MGLISWRCVGRLARCMDEDGLGCKARVMKDSGFPSCPGEDTRPLGSATFDGFISMILSLCPDAI